MFYKSVVESVLYFGIAIWGGNTTDVDKRKIGRVRRAAGRITKTTPTPLYEAYKTRAQTLCHKIMADPTHPLASEFKYLPSGRRLRQPAARTKRFRRSFIPDVIAMLRDS